MAQLNKKLAGFNPEPQQLAYFIYKVATVGGRTTQMGNPLPGDTEIITVLRAAENVSATLVHLKTKENGKPQKTYRKTGRRGQGQHVWQSWYMKE